MQTEFLDKLMNKWAAGALILAMFGIWCLHYKYVVLPEMVRAFQGNSERKMEPQHQDQAAPARYAYQRDKLSRT